MLRRKCGVRKRASHHTIIVFFNKMYNQSLHILIIILIDNVFNYRILYLPYDRFTMILLVMNHNWYKTKLSVEKTSFSNSFTTFVKMIYILAFWIKSKANRGKLQHLLWPILKLTDKAMKVVLIRRRTYICHEITTKSYFFLSCKNLIIFGTNTNIRVNNLSMINNYRPV